ncbi:MAG: DUF4124 domain-containing protein [Deltaproteobacteria bacterium]|nr:DUF4124 domain-containing protein [Deltaproteobacteria bacterium]
MSRFPIVLAAFLLLSPSAAGADIYRWVDESGTAHFTDDVSNIPAPYRGKAKTIIKEAPPETSPAPRPEPAFQPPAPHNTPASQEDAELEAARERDALASEVEQMKAKINAKETLVKTVDDRRNLALNPLRARVVDPADLDLYEKYKAELPQDRERLQELENRLQSFR